MKTILVSLILFIAITGCKKKTQEEGDWLQIEIVAQRDINCSFPNIIFLDRQQVAYQIIGDSRGTYVALGLPKVNYPVGTKMYVVIHRPSPNELTACTTLGPSWSQVFIDRIK